jgi:Glycosyl transferase family 2
MEQNRSIAPVVSVVLASDYDGGGAKGRAHVRATLRALAGQDFGEPFRILFVESDAFASDSAGLAGEVPGVDAVFVPVRGSYELKNAGVAAAATNLVALLDADCTPGPGWLRALVAAMRRHPEAAAVSGRTVYDGHGLVERALAVLTRGYLDPGGAGPTRFLSNNNCCVRRDVFLACPLPTNGGPFAARMQSEAMRRRGARLWFTPDAVVVHEFEGWPMERDIRRNIGYGTIRIRELDPAMPFAWMARLGPVSIPLFVGARTIDSWWDCLRAGRQYGLRGYELPAAFALAVVVHLLEIGGMRSAFRGRPIVETAYR